MAYRTNIRFWSLAIGAAVSFVIAIVTVSYQAIKSGLTEHAESLCYE